MPVENWVRHRVEEAARRGLFDDLPLSGKPLPRRDPQHDPDWVTDWMRREQIDVSLLLPPSLALAREVEQLPGRLAAIRDEQRVRDLVADLNRRIRAAIARPESGPPMRTRPVDVESVVTRWRETTPPPPARRATPLPPVTAPALPCGSQRATVLFGLAVLFVLAGVVVLGIVTS